MKRRTLLRTVGAVGIGSAAISGTVAAERSSLADVDVDRELDVAGVEGEVTLAELLEPRDLAGVPADVDPSSVSVTIAPAADSVTIQDCCFYCCGDVPLVCECSCCTCDDCACDDCTCDGECR